MERHLQSRGDRKGVFHKDFCLKVGMDIMRGTVLGYAFVQWAKTTIHTLKSVGKRCSSRRTSGTEGGASCTMYEPTRSANGQLAIYTRRCAGLSLQETWVAP